MVVGILLTSVYFYVTRSSFLTNLAEPILSSMSGGDATIESASFTEFRKLTLNNVHIRVPETEGVAGELIFMPAISIDIHWSRLLAGELATERIVVAPGARIRVSENTETGIFNFGGLVFPEVDSSRGLLPDGTNIIIPEIKILRATIEMGEHQGAAYQMSGSIDIAGALVPERQHRPTSDPEAHWYQVTLRELSRDNNVAASNVADNEAEDDVPETVRIDGRINPHTLQASAIISSFSFDRDRAPLLPRRIREWWNTLQPSGTLEPLAVTVLSGGQYTIEIPMNGVDWTLPIGATDSPTGDQGQATDGQAEHPLRMTDVRGSLLVRESGAEFINLSGVVEEVRYNLHGAFTSLSRTPGFDLTFKIQQFNLAQNLKILAILPSEIRSAVDEQLLQLERQSGTLNATVRLQRPELALAANEPGQALGAVDLQVEGTVQISDAEGTYRAFPYRLTGLHGEIQFSNREVKIVTLAGQTETGGDIYLAGTISELGPHPKIDLEMFANGIPLDDRLKLALGERTASQIDKFMHVPSAAALRDAGLVMSAEDRRQTQQQILELKRSVMRLKEKNAASAPDELNQADESYEATLKSIEDEISRIETQLAEVPIFELGGRVNLSSTIHRSPGPDQPLLTTTTLNLAHQAQPIGVVYNKFPYPLYFTAGKLEIGWGEVKIVEDLKFRGLTGAEVTVSGTVDRVREPTYHVEEHLKLTAHPVPIDSLLVHALPGKFKNDADREGWPGKRLTTAGQILAGLNLQADLEVEGTITHDPQRGKAGYVFGIEVSHGQTVPFKFIGGGSEPSVTDSESIAGAGAADAGPSEKAKPGINWDWPVEYPVRNLNGQLVIRRTGLTIVNLNGDLVDQGRLIVDGDLDWAVGPTDINLDFDAQNLHVSDPLIELIGGISGPKSSEQVSDFCDRYALQGDFDAILQWDRTDEDGTSQFTTLTPHQAEMTIGGVSLQFADVSGNLIFAGPLIEFDHLSAELYSTSAPFQRVGRIAVDGDLDRVEGTASRLTGTLTAGRFEADFIPGVLRALGRSDTAQKYQALDPNGAFNAQFSYGADKQVGELKTPPTTAVAVVSVRPKTAQFTLKGQRYEVDQFAGEATFDDQQVELSNLSGKYQDGEFAVGGIIDYAAGFDADLKLGLVVEKLNDRSRAIFPDAVNKTIDALELAADSAVTLADGRLRYFKPALEGDDAKEFDFTGRVELRDARMAIPVEIEQLNGEILVDVSRSIEDEWTQIDLALALASLRAEGRLIEDVTLDLVSGSSPGELLIPQAVGKCYEGMLTANARIQLAQPQEPGRYTAELRLLDVEVAPFIADSKSKLAATGAPANGIAPTGESPSQEPKPRAQGKPGLAAAHLALAGIIGDPESKRGRGEIQIVDGELYEVPFNMWALQLSALTLPVATSFEDAELLFHVKGSKVVFEKMQLESPMMSMNGTGHVEIPSGKIDLRFKTASKVRAPLLSDIWEGIRDGFFSIHVTGTMDAPETELVPFR